MITLDKIIKLSTYTYSEFLYEVTSKLNTKTFEKRLYCYIIHMYIANNKVLGQKLHGCKMATNKWQE